MLLEPVRCFQLEFEKAVFKEGRRKVGSGVKQHLSRGETSEQHPARDQVDFRQLPICETRTALLTIETLSVILVKTFWRRK